MYGDATIPEKVLGDVFQHDERVYQSTNGGLKPILLQQTITKGEKSKWGFIPMQAKNCLDQREDYDQFVWRKSKAIKEVLSQIFFLNGSLLDFIKHYRIKGSNLLQFAGVTNLMGSKMDEMYLDNHARDKQAIGREGKKCETKE